MSQSTPNNAAASTIVYGSGRRPDAGIPRPGVELRQGHVAIVVTDPQNDFLSPQGVTWSVVGQNVTDNNTVENIGQLFATAKEHDVPVFVSPHYYYPHDHRWDFEGALERLMHDIEMFDRPNALDTTAFTGSGRIGWSSTSHSLTMRNCRVQPTQSLRSRVKRFGAPAPQTGHRSGDPCRMSANLCVESHMRELVEQGFEVAVVGDATAAAQVPGYDGYDAAITNFRFIASDPWSTEEAIGRLAESCGKDLHIAGREVTGAVT